jgi:uncharacterized protein (TIGR02444 family)
MADAAAEPPEDDALWRFSLAFYTLPGVAQALIALQDRDQLDVDLMLFALWLGVSGRGRLSSDGLALADRAICTIRAEIVEPLRALRRRLRQEPGADVQCLREGVKALELAAEKLVQTRLARLAAPCGSETSRGARLATAHANLAAYLGAERARGAEAVIIREAINRYSPDGP